MDERVGAFLDEVAAWARGRPDVGGALLLGSQARADVPADGLSDVDLVLFVDDPQPYLDDADWLRAFGEPLLTFVEPTAVGGFEERRVLFRDGLEVDFSLLAASALESLPADAQAVLLRGHSVVHDEIGLAGLEVPSAAPPASPSQARLERISNDFWYHLLWSAKKLKRGELLLAKSASDCHLTILLVELVRWQARDRDTWHGYRFFERWADERVQEALPPTFAGYEAAEIGRALRAKGELFGQLERDVAELFSLVVPVDGDEILRRLDALLA